MKLCLFLLLLSFNGSPNSKLSRFFVSRVILVLLLPSSRVQFISIPQIHEIVSLIRPASAGCVRAQNVFLSSSATARKSCSIFAWMYVSKMVGCSARNTSSRDVTVVIYIDCAPSSSCYCCFSSSLCRFKKYHTSLTNTSSGATSGWRKKNNSRAKNHYFTSRSSTFLFCSLPLYICSSIYFGQIHLTNVYAHAYQWAGLLVIRNS